MIAVAADIGQKLHLFCPLREASRSSTRSPFCGCLVFSKVSFDGLGRESRSGILESIKGRITINKGAYRYLNPAQQAFGRFSRMLRWAISGFVRAYLRSLTTSVAVFKPIMVQWWQANPDVSRSPGATSWGLAQGRLRGRPCAIGILFRSVIGCATINGHAIACGKGQYFARGRVDDRTAQWSLALLSVRIGREGRLG
jgi:hypothetical protein